MRSEATSVLYSAMSILVIANQAIRRSQASINCSASPYQTSDAGLTRFFVGRASSRRLPSHGSRPD